MIEHTKASKNEIVGIAISGHSLGVVAVGEDGTSLRECTPIWPDRRAKKQAEAFFGRYPDDQWDLTTGNAFLAERYSAFKILWYQGNEPELYAKAVKFFGTKDYINFRLTDEMQTDDSYASGSGVSSLKGYG